MTKEKFVSDSLSPARVQKIDINTEERRAFITVAEDQQSLAIGKGGQNVRLAAKLTGYKIDISSAGALTSLKPAAKRSLRKKTRKTLSTLFLILNTAQNESSSRHPPRRQRKSQRHY